MTIGYMPPSKSDLHETPQRLYDKLDEAYRFTWDAAADQGNHKHPRYWTGEASLPPRGWTTEMVYWCNPPYGRVLRDWLDVAAMNNARICWLLPARTDTRWFQYYAARHPAVLMSGRLKFELDGISQAPAPFPSMLLLMNLPILPAASNLGIVTMGASAS